MDLSTTISALKDFETFWKNFAGLMKNIPAVFKIIADWTGDTDYIGQSREALGIN